MATIGARRPIGRETKSPRPAPPSIFPGSNTTTNNDLTGLTVQSIEFASNNFAVGGNSLTLSSGVSLDVGVSGETISLPVALGGPVTISMPATTGNGLTISGVVSGSNSLTYTGSGTLTLTGANTYTGGTNIGNGSEVTLAFANGSLGTTGNITINGSVLQWLPGNTQDVSARLR